MFRKGQALGTNLVFWSKNTSSKFGPSAGLYMDRYHGTCFSPNNALEDLIALFPGGGAGEEGE